MAHYAFIKDNLVTEVIVGKDETETAPEGFSDWEAYYLTKRPDQDSCKRTSYNTISNTHRENGTAFRGNYAAIGYTYDEVNDVFYPPSPYNSWSLDSNWVWQPPVAYPDDGQGYTWDEDTVSWVLIEE